MKTPTIALIIGLSLAFGPAAVWAGGPGAAGRPIHKSYAGHKGHKGGHRGHKGGKRSKKGGGGTTPPPK